MTFYVTFKYAENDVVYEKTISTKLKSYQANVNKCKDWCKLNNHIFLTLKEIK